MEHSWWLQSAEALFLSAAETWKRRMAKIQRKLRASPTNCIIASLPFLRPQIVCGQGCPSNWLVIKNKSDELLESNDFRSGYSDCRTFGQTRPTNSKQIQSFGTVS